MKRAFVAVFALAFCAAPQALADDSTAGFSAPGAAQHFTPEVAARFAKQVENDLAQQGARVAIVFRTGRARSQLPGGISYTHGAFWVYQTIHLADGRDAPGYAVYNLYVGDGAQARTSRLAQDFPVNFTVGAVTDDIAIIVPTPEMQRRILLIMGSPRYEQLHQPSYSLIANPFELRHQNCNTFMLDVIAAAAWETTDQAQIAANLRAHFTPTEVNVSGVQRLFGPLFDPRVQMDDQHARIVTAGYESMSAFMQQNGLADRAYVLERDPNFTLSDAASADQPGSRQP